MKKIIYWLFDSENKDLNDQINEHLNILGNNPNIIDFFNKINN